MVDAVCTIAVLFSVCAVYYSVTFGIIQLMLRLGYDEWDGLTAAIIFWGAILSLAVLLFLIIR